MHGDTLCTDDVDYQRFRAEVRAPRGGRNFFSLTLAARKEKIGALRAQSETEKRRKSPEIMDVNRGAVEAILREHGYPRLIHGHTHRPPGTNIASTAGSASAGCCPTGTSREEFWCRRERVPDAKTLG